MDSKDRDILRRLAGRKAEIAADPVNLERREAWYRLDAGKGDRTMILAEPFRPEGAGDALECSDPWARGLEQGLRAEIWRFETLRDDWVVQPQINVRWQAGPTDYFGVSANWVRPEGGGAARIVPAINDLDREFGKLHRRQFAVNRQKTLDEKERLERVFAGILDVRIRGAYWWTTGLTQDAVNIIGLEPLMLWMYDNPAGIHRLMALLRDDFIAWGEWLEREGLFTPNNENDYIGSGSLGYTRDLPRADLPAGAPPRRRDLWVLSESQETVGVGPEQFEEFVFPYQKAITDAYGKVYYGCCEPVHSRIHILKKMKNLARVSVSPWADEEIMARELGRDLVFSRKPNPTLVSTEVFDEDAIRADLRRTLGIARGCRLEIILKDIHTTCGDATRIPRWVRIAREECDAAG